MFAPKVNLNWIEFFLQFIETKDFSQSPPIMWAKIIKYTILVRNTLKSWVKGQGDTNEEKGSFEIALVNLHILKQYISQWKT